MKPKQKPKQKQNEYWCIAIFNGQSFGNIVIDKNPIDWLHEKIVEMDFKASIVVMGTFRINKIQYNRGLKLSQQHLARMDKERKKQAEMAKEKVLSHSNQE